MKARFFLLLSAGVVALTSAASAAEPDGKALFAANCATCHGMDLGGYIAPALNRDSLADRFDIGMLPAFIAGGVPNTLMPAWESKLSPEELKAIASYVLTTPKQSVSWGIEDIRQSLEVYVEDEGKLPSAPTYAIDSIDDLMAVVARGRYSQDTSKVVFLNGATNDVVGEVAVDRAPHIVDFDPANDRWAYLKTDGGRLYKIDLYSMQAVRSVQVGFTGPSLAVSWDGRYVAAGSFVPNTAAILDATTLEPVKFLDLGGIDPDGKNVEADSGGITATPYGPYIAFTLEQAGQVWIVDTSKPDLPVTKITDVGRHLHDSYLSPDGRYMFVAAYDDNKVAVIDFETKQKVRDIAAGCVPHTGSGAVYKTKAGRTLGVQTNFGSGKSCDKTVVTVFDVDSGEVVKQIPVSGGTESPAAHPAAPYFVVDIISGDDVDKVTLINKESLEVEKVLEVGGHAYFPEFTARGDFLYVSAGYNGDKLVIFRSDTLERVKEIPMESPAGIFSHVRPKIRTVGLAPQD